MKRLLIVLLVAVAFIFSLGSCATAKKKVKKKVKKPELTLKKDPEEPEDWANNFTIKGIKALEVKNGEVDFKKAVMYFNKAVKAYPSAPFVHYNLGLVYQRKGDDQEAIKHYDKALSLNSKYSMPVINKASIYANKLEYNRAVEVCVKFLENENDKDKVVLSALAGFYLLKGDYIDAIHSVRQILIQDQVDVDALKNLGMIYYKMNDVGLATMVTTNSYNLKKSDSGIANNRGVLYSSLSDDSLAMLYFAKAIRNDSKNKSANFNVASIAMKYGDSTTAYDRYSLVLSQDPDNLNARIGLALALRGIGRFADAEKEYKKVLEKDPNNSIAIFNLGVLYYDHMNKKVEAKRNFRKYLSTAQDIKEDSIVHKYLKDKVNIRPVEEIKE